MTKSLRIGITAPNASTAFALEEVLSHLGPTVLGSSEAWLVEIEGDEDRFDDIVAAVRQWLRDIDLDWTDLHLGGAVQRLGQVEPRPAVLGSGYDEGPVLTHEP